MSPRHISKFLSLILRHQPDKLGIQLDPHGWANVNEIIQKMNDKGMVVDLEKIKYVVENNNKQRFKLDEAGGRIRANQGHSIAVDVELPITIPPAILYHGTAERFKASIFREGIRKQKRQHVHLSKDVETAIKVGQRHGKVVVLEVDAKRMQEDGQLFYLSENGVWLTDYVATDYLSEG